MGDLHWKTKITGVAPNSLLVRGYRLDELMGRASFGGLVCLLLKGELPSGNHGKMIEAVLVSCVDHGATPPSTLAARTAVSTGTPLNAAVAAGILAISRFHGGAIEDCMKILHETGALIKDGGASSVREAAEIIVKKYREQGKRLPGFGHRLHTDDPRTAKLFQLAESYQVGEMYISIAKALQEQLLARSGKKLPINVDGAIAAVLCELGFDPECANAFFMIARLPGLVAHILEERNCQQPMRRIDPVDHQYDGPEQRPLPEDL